MAERNKSGFLAVEPTLQSSPRTTFRFPERMLVVAKQKAFIIRSVSAAFLLSILISVLLPNTYTGITNILPPQKNQSMTVPIMLNQVAPAGSLAGSPSTSFGSSASLASLSSALGVKSGGEVYVSILTSRTVADNLIERFDLLKVYRKTRVSDVRKILQDRTQIIEEKSGVISISVEDHDPGRAANLANGYVEELEKLSKMLAVTEAGKRRFFFEQEMNTARDELSRAELALKRTQENTGLILLDSQTRAMLDELVSLRAGIAAKEVQIEALGSFATAENPELIRAKQEFAAMRLQIEKLEHGQHKRGNIDVPLTSVPTAGLEYLRKLRETKYREALFMLLAKQFEAAKIDEGRDNFIVQTLDRAIPPERKSGPYRSIIVLFITLLAFMVAYVIAVIREKFGRAKANPQFMANFQLFKFYLRVWE